MLLRILTVFLISSSLLSTAYRHPEPIKQSIDTNPPDNPVKLIFIHHSTGENWLSDENGGLAAALQQNNYFVSDTNYGWGPDAIGDRTDIPNWLEWFRSDGTDRYMQAAFDENEVHSPFNRTLADPGGENQVVLFKSCFPNSSLSGSPNDPPSEGTDFNVGNAKYVYNEILKYFASRPNKLFVVITAPPLTDGQYAKNARGFNNWLVNDWLIENNYTLRNVAVFDFYNILTSPKNHHWINNGVVEHVIETTHNTEYYPTDDDHPSQAGNRKATAEFIPMLNSFYHQWQSGGVNPVPAVSESQPSVPGNIDPAESAQPTAMLADFEGEGNVWEAYQGEQDGTHILCYQTAEYAQAGSQSLQIDFDIPPGSWGTCALSFSSPQDWTRNNGITFYLYAIQPGSVLHIDLYSGQPEAQNSFVYEMNIPANAVDTWMPVAIPWNEFTRVSWEEDAGSPFTETDHVLGLAFGFPEGEGKNNADTIWIDNVQLLGPAVQPVPEIMPTKATIDQTEEPAQEATPTKKPFLPVCGSVLLFPLGLLLFTSISKRNRA